MKTKVLITLFCLCFGIYGFSQSNNAQKNSQNNPQQKTITNKYSMKLQENGDGSYELINRKRYAKIINLNAIEDLLVPFTLERKQLKSSDYKGIKSIEVEYKKHKDYSLKLSIDLANTDSPAPVVFYLHGGGWARGTKDSPRVLSQYMAKQKGVCGVRVQYSLAPQNGANVEVSVNDILDAVKYIKEHAKEYNINPEKIGFVGTSAGAHLAAVAALKTKEAKVFVGYSGIYNLETAAITTRARDAQRLAYFNNLDSKTLSNYSPVNLVNKKTNISALLFCGTADITVEYSQSTEFAQVLKKCNVDLQVYENYDHNLSSNSSDKMEEIFFKTVVFISNYLL